MGVVKFSSTEPLTKNQFYDIILSAFKKEARKSCWANARSYCHMADLKVFRTARNGRLTLTKTQNRQGKTLNKKRSFLDSPNKNVACGNWSRTKIKRRHRFSDDKSPGLGIGSRQHSACRALHERTTNVLHTNA